MGIYCEPSTNYLATPVIYNSIISSKANTNLDVNPQLIQNKSPTTAPLSPSSKISTPIMAKSRTYNSLKIASNQHKIKHKIKQKLLSTPKCTLSSSKKAELIRYNLAKSRELVNQMDLIKKELMLIAENVRILESLN